MIKVLIGDQNIQKDINNFRFLNNDNEYQVVTSVSGMETITKCRENEPSIIILGSKFDDMKYTDVIDKISDLPSEFNKCNLILTLNNPKDKLCLSNTAIIYKVFDNPVNENTVKDTINNLKQKYEMPELTLNELRYNLLCLGINTYSNSSQYLTSAIFKCYYHPEYFITLDNIYEIIAEEYNVSKEQIKNGIRHLIDTFNKSYNLINKDLYDKIFINRENVSPKQFIQRFVNYLQTIKGQS